MLKNLQWFLLVLSAVILLVVLPYCLFTGAFMPEIVFSIPICGLAGVYAMMQLFWKKDETEPTGA